MPAPIALILLAAGGSTRMGQPKQLLPFLGQSLLRRAATVALQSGCAPLIVVLGDNAPRLLQELTDLPVTPVDNPNWRQGMGSSLVAGMTAVQSPDIAGVAVTLCDQPHVDAIALARLIETFHRTGQPVAASYAGTVGVPAVFPRSMFAAIRTLDPAVGAKRLLAGPDVIGVDLPAAAMDVDTPEDYHRLVSPPGPSQIIA